MDVSFFTALLTNPFLQLSIFAGLAASLAGGIIDSYVVVKRIVFIGGSISHAVLGGIGFFLFLKHLTGIRELSPLIGGLASALIFGFVIGYVHLNYKEREDSIIAAIWSFGMALGVIFISITPGNNSELMNFLFGNILWATPFEVITLITFDFIIIIAALLLHKRFLAISFDETQAYLQRQPVTLLYFILLSLISMTIVLMIQIIGAILVIAMLSLPAAIANFLTHRLSRMILYAVILSSLFSLVGIYISYEFNWPPGATIALITTVVYFLSLPLNKRVV